MSHEVFRVESVHPGDSLFGDQADRDDCLDIGTDAGSAQIHTVRIDRARVERLRDALTAWLGEAPLSLESDEE